MEDTNPQGSAKTVDDAAAQITLNELYSKLNRGPEDAIFY